jgi:hypothetical protein
MHANACASTICTFKRIRGAIVEGEHSGRDFNPEHTATLEDFKLKDDPSLLYTPEALAAGRAQDEREYQKLLKELWQ